MTGAPSQAADEFLALWRRVEAGELTPPQAQYAAIALGAAMGESMAMQVEALVGVIEDLAHAGRWKRALGLATLARAAVSGVRPRSLAAEHAAVLVTAAFVEVAHTVLVDHPDPQLYAVARNAGEEAGERAASAGWPRLQGLLLFRLGTMLLDAYTAGRDQVPGNYEHTLNLWKERAHNQDDPALKRLLSHRLTLDEAGTVVSMAPSDSMPEPLDALLTAEDYFRRALPLVSDERRGRTLKALFQALDFKEFLGGDIEEAELLDVSRRALEELPAGELQARLAVMVTLQRRGADVDAAGWVEKLEQDFESLAESRDEMTAWDAVGQAAALVQKSDPERALALLMLRRRLSSPWESSVRRAAHYHLELVLLMNRDAPRWVTATAYADRSIVRASARALAEAESSPPGSTARSRAAACLAVLALASGFDEERIALDQQERRRLSTIDPSLAEEHQEVIFHLLASLHQGEAVNSVGAEQHRRALAHYLTAAPMFMYCQFFDEALHCLRGIDDMLARGSIADVTELTRELAEWAWPLEVVLPTAAPLVLRRLYGRAIWVALNHGNDVETVFTLLQLAKGFLSSIWMAQGISDFTLGEAEQERLARARALERELPVTESPLRAAAVDPVFEEDEMLVAYAGLPEDTPAATVGDRLANLERAFEAQLLSCLASSVEANATVLSSEQISAALDDRTVLLQLYHGPTLGDDQMEILSVATTAEGHNFGVDTADTTWLPTAVEHGGRSLTVAPLARIIAELREAVQRDPRPRLVTPVAQETLSGLPELYWRPLTERLAELAASGKDQLIVVPYGETHVCPIHLAGDDRILADDWTVSYGLGLRDAVRGSTRGDEGIRRRKGGAVFGMSYENDPRMPTLSSSVTEANAIAAVLGVPPVMDGQATPDVVKHALETHRWVHVRAHGRHNVAAPFLQTVFLSPSRDHDGRLRAYEIFSLELHGLEVVTLGACETSLGRVDLSDNPRGLIAALLGAGAQNVVGTLWQVLADASTVFFTAFYRALVEAQVGVRAAYANAQRHTRQKFPAYRDWGAFMLTGSASS